MIRFLSAAGVAVYVLALSTAFPSIQSAWEQMGAVAPAAVAAEAGAPVVPARAGAIPRDRDAGAVSARSRWDVDRDGMLMDEAGAAEPFAVLNPV